MAVLITVLGLGACTPEPTLFSEFDTIDDDGWYASMPLRYSLQLTDSIAPLCNVEVAVRHNNNYRYSNLNIVVDLVDSTYKVTRYNVAMPITNEYGDWTGRGFGSLYQDKVTVARGVNPSTLRSIVVWQAMKGCDKVTDIENVGVIITSVNN